jgi:hypothetical protein
MREQSSPINESSGKGRRLAIALGLSAIASFGAHTLSSEGKSAEDNRYPAPAAADTLRLQHIAKPGDNPSTVAHELANQFNNRSPNSNGHLSRQEVQDHMYSVGGETPEGHDIPQEDNRPQVGKLVPGEHVVSDIPTEEIYEDQ